MARYINGVKISNTVYRSNRSYEKRNKNNKNYKRFKNGVTVYYD